MARIVIASASAAGRGQLSGLLASSGLKVFRSCGSAGELRRALSECEDGVVIMMGPLPGCEPDALQWDYAGQVQILLIGRPPWLSSCESPDIFRLPLPVSGQAVVGAVEMLAQLHQMRLPKRAGPEKRTVEEAKALLMRRQGITEAEAHRALQQQAMRRGMKMADYAAQIIQSSKETEEST